MTFIRAKALRRKERRMVDFLITQNETEIVGTNEIIDGFISYFKTIFTSSYARTDLFD